jgi:hypothetical protein
MPWLFGRTMPVASYISELECLEYGKQCLTSDNKNKKHSLDQMHVLSMWVILEFSELSVTMSTASFSYSQVFMGIDISFGIKIINSIRLLH